MLWIQSLITVNETYRFIEEWYLWRYFIKSKNLTKTFILLLAQALIELDIFNLNLIISFLYDSRIIDIVNPFVNSSSVVSMS